MILFTVQIHSVIDIITNSSSELFVGLHNSKDIMKDMIEQVYPNYLDEYEELKSIDELRKDELELYISYNYEYWSNNDQRTIQNVIDGFKPEEMYETKTFKGGHSYTQLIDNFIDNHYERIKNGIDPERKMFFLFSFDDNPNWDMQEKLEKIMNRYHLG